MILTWASLAEEVGEHDLVRDTLTTISKGRRRLGIGSPESGRSGHESVQSPCASSQPRHGCLSTWSWGSVSLWSNARAR